jgi:hypothetical protein
MLMMKTSQYYRQQKQRIKEKHRLQEIQNDNDHNSKIKAKPNTFRTAPFMKDENVT